MRLINSYNLLIPRLLLIVIFFFSIFNTVGEVYEICVVGSSVNNEKIGDVVKEFKGL